jgi:hypothetical protein
MFSFTRKKNQYGGSIGSASKTKKPTKVIDPSLVKKKAERKEALVLKKAEKALKDETASSLEIQRQAYFNQCMAEIKAGRLLLRTARGDRELSLEDKRDARAIQDSISAQYKQKLLDQQKAERNRATVTTFAALIRDPGVADDADKRAASTILSKALDTVTAIRASWEGADVHVQCSSVLGPFFKGNNVCWLCGFPIFCFADAVLMRNTERTPEAYAWFRGRGVNQFPSQVNFENNGNLIMDKNTCEHILNIKLAAGTLGLWVEAINGRLHPGWQAILAAEYQWAHNYCNYMKNDLTFLSLPKGRADFSRLYVNRGKIERFLRTLPNDTYGESRISLTYRPPVDHTFSTNNPVQASLYMMAIATRGVDPVGEEKPAMLARIQARLEVVATAWLAGATEAVVARMQVAANAVIAADGFVVPGFPPPGVELLAIAQGSTFNLWRQALETQDPPDLTARFVGHPELLVQHRLQQELDTASTTRLVAGSQIFRDYLRDDPTCRAIYEGLFTKDLGGKESASSAFFLEYSTDAAPLVAGGPPAAESIDTGIRSQADGALHTLGEAQIENGTDTSIEYTSEHLITSAPNAAELTIARAKRRQATGEILDIAASRAIAKIKESRLGPSIGSRSSQFKKKVR